MSANTISILKQRWHPTYDGTAKEPIPPSGDQRVKAPKLHITDINWDSLGQQGEGMIREPQIRVARLLQCYLLRKPSVD